MFKELLDKQVNPIVITTDGNTSAIEQLRGSGSTLSETGIILAKEISEELSSKRFEIIASHSYKH